MQDFSTPMMKQYLQIKQQYPDCLLFYRMGDFYELFMDDAFIGAKILNITLTSRPKGKDGRIPMAGVPYHAVDAYLSKLVKAGYKVAICEQISLPSKKGIIDRQVIRVVTPGTVLDEKALEKKENNYIISITMHDQHAALAACDLSTGYFAYTALEVNQQFTALKEEIAKLHPSECILSDELYNNPQLLKSLKAENNLNIFPFTDWRIHATKAKKILKQHFQVGTLAAFNLEDHPLVIEATGVLLGYLKQTQKNDLHHINKISSLSDNEHVVLDRSTIINLELFSTIREHDTRGSLLSVMDQTVTSMGGRLLKSWLMKPLVAKEQIEERYDAVNELMANFTFQNQLREYLQQIPDMERIVSRLSVGLGNARDLVNLKLALKTALEINLSLKDATSMILKNSYDTSPPEINSLVNLIEENIADEPPIDLKIGGLIKEGVDKKLDELRFKVNKSKEWITELEVQERERTGINSLKVRFNKVFGFYIEISKSNLANVPDDYMRKQTLVNGERFITPELKQQEEIILTAEETIIELEYRLFLEIVEKVLAEIIAIQEIAKSLAIIDCLTSFAYLAQKERYIRPNLIYSGEIKIKNGRHPVVEKLLEESTFVPNSVEIGAQNPSLLLITGPNMAGKSVFIRQIALLVLMAQIGSFIPAEQAYISLVDRIFVRSGASDVITSGLSTFMVEMVETAHILHNATKDSLIIMDEIGRGTSTYDGISIAWAVAEYLVNHFKQTPKTLFATHYHELQKLEDAHPQQIKNYSMGVVNENAQPIFLYTLQPGGASSSFGVAVARLAGVPEQVISQAKYKLKTLESQQQSSMVNENKSGPSFQIETISLFDQFIFNELENLDIHQMTPLEALNKLADIKDQLKIVHQQPANLLETN